MALEFGISLSFQIHPDWARAGHLGREKKQLIRLVDDALRTDETSSGTAAGFPVGGVTGDTAVLLIQSRAFASQIA